MLISRLESGPVSQALKDLLDSFAIHYNVKIVEFGKCLNFIVVVSQFHEENRDFKNLGQWFSVFLMFCPFNIAPYAVVRTNIILLLLPNCNFATAMN